MNTRRVYSTESGRICPNCDRALANCQCQRGGKNKHKGKGREQAKQTLKQTIPSDGIVRLLRETKGRKGAGATLVHGLQAEPSELKELAKQLKQLCGCGGAVKNGVIEIQGDQREKIKSWLESRDYKVKLAGG